MDIKDIEDLTPDKRNANKGKERGRKLVKHSLEKVKAGRSIVTDRNGQVIAGNKTLEAAKELGYTITPVHTRGDELVVVVRDDLDLDKDPEARWLAYADNRVAEVGLEWDEEVRRQDIEAGLDLEPLWSSKDLEEELGELPEEIKFLKFKLPFEQWQIVMDAIADAKEDGGEEVASNEDAIAKICDFYSQNR